MGKDYTEAQKRASLKYQANKAQIKITVSKEQRDKFQKHAESKGLPLTQLILDLLNKDIEAMLSNQVETYLKENGIEDENFTRAYAKGFSDAINLKKDCMEDYTKETGKELKKKAKEDAD